MLPDQQTPETAAVNKKIPRYGAAAGGERLNGPLGTGINAGDIGENMVHPEPVHRVIAQQFGEFCRVEVITVVQGEGVIGNL